MKRTLSIIITIMIFSIVSLQNVNSKNTTIPNNNAIKHSSDIIMKTAKGIVDNTNIDIPTQVEANNEVVNEKVEEINNASSTNTTIPSSKSSTQTQQQPTSSNTTQSNTTVSEKVEEPVVEEVVEIVNESSLGNQIFQLVNQYRQENGIDTIEYSSNQYNKAANLANQRANENQLNTAHYANEISAVYRGTPSVATIVDMWKNSPDHNTFLLNSRKHFGGCAVYRNGSNYYIIFEGRIDDR